MSFATLLDSYCAGLGMTNKQIAQRCGISSSALSRYRAGSRTPAKGGTVIPALAQGIAALSLETGIGAPLSADEIETALESARTGSVMAGMDFATRLDRLMTTLGIRNVELARLIQIDSSYLSRIRNAQRKSSDPEKLAEACARLAASLTVKHGSIEKLASLIDSVGVIGNDELPESNLEEDLASIITSWLLGDDILQSDIAELTQLLTRFDAFDFYQALAYIEASEDPPPVDVSPRSQYYYGTKDMRKAEIEFLDIAAATLASNVVIFNDFPLVRSNAGTAFLDQHISGLRRLVKGGARIDVIHNVERPLSDTITALRYLLPLYMTGKVTPYYLKGAQTRTFFHVSNSCESCALSAEAIIGHQTQGRYLLSTLPEDIAFYQRRGQHLLEKSISLLEIYRQDDPGQAEAFRSAMAKRLSSGEGERIGRERYKNLAITVYPADCVVVSFLRDPVTHFIIHHPRLRYAFSLMS